MSSLQKIQERKKQRQIIPQRNNQRKPKSETFYGTTSLVSLAYYCDEKKKKKNCHRLKETYRTLQIQNVGLDYVLAYTNQCLGNVNMTWVIHDFTYY